MFFLFGVMELMLSNGSQPAYKLTKLHPLKMRQKISEIKTFKQYFILFHRPFKKNDTGWM